jgi:hypothetical protein
VNHIKAELADLESKHKALKHETADALASHDLDSVCSAKIDLRGIVC